jgi:outer membrane biosynthesis protein TonB
MQKRIIHSIILHILIVLVFLFNFQTSKKPKKISSQKLVVNIGGKPKNIKVDQPPIPNPIKEVVQPITPKEVIKEKKVEKVEQPVKKEVTKPEEQIVEKVKQKIPKEEIKKDLPKPEEKKVEKVEKKRKEKETEKTDKKVAKKEVKKEVTKPKPQPVKKESQSDVFSQLLGDVKESPMQEMLQVADLSDDDIAIIRGQISRNWIQTPCIGINGMELKLEILVNANCEVTSAKIQDMQKRTYSEEGIACANSALRAAQQVEKLDLKLEKCKEINNELIVLNFPTGS